MDHEHDAVSGQPAPDPQHRRGCRSTFDRWRCVLPAGHEGLHRSGDDGGRAEWNDRATGRSLHSRPEPDEGDGSDEGDRPDDDAPGPRRSGTGGVSTGSRPADQDAATAAR